MKNGEMVHVVKKKEEPVQAPAPRYTDAELQQLNSSLRTLGCTPNAPGWTRAMQVYIFIDTASGANKNLSANLAFFFEKCYVGFEPDAHGGRTAEEGKEFLLLNFPILFWLAHLRSCYQVIPYVPLYIVVLP